eukprot:5785060-Pleurochrysis_carterae.AAC.1
MRIRPSQLVISIDSKYGAAQTQHFVTDFWQILLDPHATFNSRFQEQVNPSDVDPSHTARAKRFRTVLRGRFVTSRSKGSPTQCESGGTFDGITKSNHKNGTFPERVAKRSDKKRSFERGGRKGPNERRLACTAGAEEVPREKYHVRSTT